MLDTMHPNVGIDYMSIATFAFGWITNCMHQDSWMQCAMYFGAPTTDAKKTSGSTDAAATDSASTGMIGSVLAMLGVPSFIISMLAMVGLK